MHTNNRYSVEVKAVKFPHLHKTEYRKTFVKMGKSYILIPLVLCVQRNQHRRNDEEEGGRK